MYDLIFNIISYCALSCNMGKISGSDKLLIKTLKRENV